MSRLLVALALAVSVTVGPVPVGFQFVPGAALDVSRVSWIS